MIIALLRGLFVIFNTLVVAFLLFLIRSPYSSKRVSLLKWWGQSICTVLGIRIHLHSPLPKEASLLIVNHRSYTDIPVLMGLKPSIFLAKAEVKTWPIIGWGAKNAYTVFVDRMCSESRQQARKDLRQRIEDGLSILVFAEGTTTPWKEMKPLKPGMFHEAHEGQLPLKCLCLEYDNPQDAWVNDDTVGRHFLERFSKWVLHTMTVDVYIKEDDLKAENPKEQCAEALQWMENQLHLHHKK